MPWLALRGLDGNMGSIHDFIKVTNIAFLVSVARSRNLYDMSELPGIGQLITRILAWASVGRVVIYPTNGLGDSNDLYNEAGQSNQRKALSAIRARIDRVPYLISVLFFV